MASLPNTQNTIADALAEMLVSKDLDPPFVLGILGKRGRGKSIFFNLMMRKMIEIQKKDAALIRDTFVGHIYVVKFDCSTFAKDSIWGSLMYQILKDLNEQLQFEELIMTPEPVKEPVKTEVPAEWPAEVLVDVPAEVLAEVPAGNSKFARISSSIMAELTVMINFIGNNDESRTSLIPESVQAEVPAKVSAESSKLTRILSFILDVLTDMTNFIGNKKEPKNDDLSRDLDPSLLTRGGISTIEILNDLNNPEIDFLTKGLTKEKFQKLRDNSDLPSNTLLDVIYHNYEEELNEVNEIINEIKEKAWNRVCAVAEESGSMFLSGVYSDYVRLHKNGEDKGAPSVSDIKEYIHNMSPLKTWWLKFDMMNLPPHVLLILIGLIILAIVLFIMFEDSILAFVAGAAGPIFMVMTSISMATNKFKPIADKLHDSFEQVEQSVLSEDLELGERKSKIGANMLLLKGRSLIESVKEIDSSIYVPNLGITQEVKKNLENISSAMLNKDTIKDKFPRGPPRIVLFVDGLNQCEQDVVVKVIEALQLLVKTKLFVSVLAIDPIYVSLAIEKHYSKIHDQRTRPTGMDFLEKIIQIPFRLPSTTEDTIDGFIENLVEFEKLKSKDVNQPLSNTTSTDNHWSPVANEDLIVRESISVAEATKNGYQNEAHQSTKIPFTKEEVEMMKEIFKLFHLVPCCMRKVVNIFKLLKVIWKRNSKFKENDNLKRATLFLMLMASNEMTQHNTYQIFEWMEIGMATYHCVAPEKEEGRIDGVPTNNLATLFKAQLQRTNERLKNSEKIEVYALNHYIDKYLSEYTWESLDEWNEISAQFLLARSFSLFRLQNESSFAEETTPVTTRGRD